MSKRLPIFREGVETVDGRLILPGAVTVESRQIPLTTADERAPGVGHDGSRIRGFCYDIALEDEGWVWGTITFTGTPVTGLYPEVDIDQADYDFTEDLILVKRGRLRAVHLGDRPAWEGMQHV